MNEGWKCPGCGACYAPFVQACGKCLPSPETDDWRWQRRWRTMRQVLAAQHERGLVKEVTLDSIKAIEGDS